MSIADAAGAVLPYRDVPWKVRMVAIAGCESGYDRTALGDAREDYPASDPLRTTPYYVRATYHGRTAEWTSVGLWQINMHYHSGRLQNLTGSTRPNEWAFWLMSPQNAARAADAVYAAQGYRAWSCYNSGGYRRYLVDAWQALDQAVRFVSGGRESLGPVPRWVFDEAAGEQPPAEESPPPAGGWQPPSDIDELLRLVRTLRDNPRDWLTWWLTAARDRWMETVFETNPERLQGTLRTLVERPNDFLAWWLTASLPQWYPPVLDRLVRELVQYIQEHPEALEREE
jgi:hypothetical protein